MIAHRVAAPVLERAPARGVVAGVVRTAAYLELDGFVVAVTTRGVPLMPNGVALTDRARRSRLAAGRRAGPLPRAGSMPAIARSRGRPSGRRPGIRRSRRSASTSPRCVGGPGDPRARGSSPVRSGGAGAGVRGRGLETAAQRAGGRGAPALDRHPRAAAARAALLGRGSGLTPEGDDLLAGGRGRAVAGPAAGWTPASARLAAGAAPAGPAAPDHAAVGDAARAGHRRRVVEPVHGLLDLTSAAAGPGAAAPRAHRALDGTRVRGRRRLRRGGRVACAHERPRSLSGLLRPHAGLREL